MKVTDVMSENVECISPVASLQEAAGRMRSLGVGSLPVCENDRIIGMITDRDITLRSVAEGQDPKLDVVRDAMTPEIVYCFEDQDVSEAAQLMRDKQIRRLPVMNRNKRLVGIVSLGDIATESGAKQLAGDALEGISEPALAGAE